MTIITTTEPIDAENVGFVGYMTMPDKSNPDPYADANPKRKKMSEYDQTYIKTLMAAYPGDYKKMHRDIKINYKQFSESQLKKEIEKYNSLPESQKV
jgi:hypothetical protein